VHRVQGPYSIPRHLSEHISFVSGLTNFPKPTKAQLFGSKFSSLPGFVQVPYSIKNQYNMPQNLVNRSPKNSQSVVQFIKSHSFSYADLYQFQKGNNVPNTTITTLGKFIGNNLESTLDIQYITGIGVGGNEIDFLHSKRLTLVDQILSSHTFLDVGRLDLRIFRTTFSNVVTASRCVSELGQRRKRYLRLDDQPNIQLSRTRHQQSDLHRSNQYRVHESWLARCHFDCVQASEFSITCLLGAIVSSTRSCMLIISFFEQRRQRGVGLRRL
jgi:hypothetical protein